MARLDLANAGAGLLETVSDQVASSIETNRRSFFILQKHILQAKAHLLKGFLEVVNNEIQGLEKLEQVTTQPRQRVEKIVVE